MTSRVQKLANEVLDALGSCGLSLATAESCTGGGIGQALTAVPGSSQIYRGGIPWACIRGCRFGEVCRRS